LLVSEMLGRGAGDGTLGITNQRIIHVGQRFGSLEIQRSDIRSISKKWIVLPGSSQLDIVVKENDKNELYSFYSGTGFCKDVIKILS